MKVIIVLLVVALAISGWLLFPESVQAQDPAVNRLILMPTADALPRRTCFGLHVLSYPTTVVPQFNIPMGRRFALLTYAGLGAEVYYRATWGLASVALKCLPLVPDSSHWGLALQGQLVGGAFIVTGWETVGGVGILPLGQLVVSSPQRPQRVHAGIAIAHVLRKYLLTPFAGGELSVSRRVKIITEFIWTAPGGDQDDSYLLGIVGFRFKLGKTTLDLSSGIFHYTHYTYPIPPLVALAVQL
ncbi:MAG: hypothetical protein WBC98_01920 [Candidatus Zixiibacteriota bacterium]